MTAPLPGGELCTGAPEWTEQVASRRPADWVHDIAKEFRKERCKKVFARSPFGFPEASILGALNHAAQELRDGHTTSGWDLIGFRLGHDRYETTNRRPCEVHQPSTPGLH
jgi:hypothetical protein